MVDYQAPVLDMLFVLYECCFADIGNKKAFSSQSLDMDTVESILKECNRFVRGEIAPLNRKGDEAGVVFDEGRVITPEGFKKAYRHWSEQGWVGLSGMPEYGGQGMPKVLAMCVGEMLFATNSAFALYPELAAGAAHLISQYAGDTLKKCYLPKLYSGQWSATMCLTEAHCGSDLALIKTGAIPEKDDAFRISGEKIFISGGEHDLCENIIHLVLARLPDAPRGVKGISLFLVPKMCVDNENGHLTKNSVICTGIEKKMGIRAASTCVMRFDGALGYLVGERHQGLSVMFSMMNHERLSISMQGLGLGEMSFQTALDYARNRIQGKNSEGESVPVIKHGDVRRMLLTMKALNEGGRAFAAYVSLWNDKADSLGSSSEKKQAMARVSLLTPVVKAFITDMGFDVCVLGQQVLGGHGYIREWGQEQHVRDARIAQIYEGTNGIQSLDLLNRKIRLDKGQAFEAFVREIKEFLLQSFDPCLDHYKQQLGEAVLLLRKVTGFFVNTADERQAQASAVEYLHMLGYVVYAYMWLEMALVSKRALGSKEGNINSKFYQEKIDTCDFYFARVLPRIFGLERILTSDRGISCEFI